jgi:2-iminobutanoate/2-iminopropanoate deaminase
MKNIIKTSNAPQAIGPYSQGLIAGDFVFTSGQIHLTPDGKLVEGTVEEQMHQVMKNLEAILEAGNVTFKNVVKTTIYVTDISDFEKMNEVYKIYMSEPYPARETVSVGKLPKGARFEISMVAVKD